MAGILSEKINKNFIVLEGIDGSGKTMILEMLRQYYISKNRKDVLFTFEHTRQGGEWSNKIEEIIHGKTAEVPPEKLQLLYILDRKDHIVEVIAPALKKGDLVYCSRYFLSTLAYGSYSGKIHWKTLWNNHKEIIGDAMVMPVKTIFIDVAPDIAIQRTVSRGSDKTIFEVQEKLSKIREAYLSIGPHFDGFEMVDGNGTPEHIFELIKQRITAYL